MARSRSSSDPEPKAEKTVSVAGKIKFGDGARGRGISGRDTVFQTGGGAYVGGNVSTGGGDFVGRDQVKTVYQQGASVKDLERLLDEIRDLLPQADLNTELAQVIDADFRMVEDQAAKEHPMGGLIKSRLNGILQMIQEAGETSDAVEKILKLLGKGVALAGALF
ncbi:MAG: hypothetical protein U9Q81_25780 [Pseudomonadota bacterium]|nr:hypothetical protein [Pseudomonadota bacterium]